MIRIYNTLTRKKEDFVPLKKRFERLRREKSREMLQSKGYLF